LFGRYGVDLVLDVGANVGDYARGLRKVGYQGRIVSFEPLAAPFARLSRAAQDDALWDIEQTALGDFSGTTTIHVAGNLDSSSLLEMLPAHSEGAPESKYVGAEQVQVRKLDSGFAGWRKGARSVYLKIDAQGYERHVLEGARESLPGIVGVQLELSLVPLYQGAPLICEMLDYLYSRGFALMSVEPGFSNRFTGEMLQVDGIFYRPVREEVSACRGGGVASA